MEMSNMRAESHVAQQRRRHKLRIQQNSDLSAHIEDYTQCLEQLSVHPQGLNSDFIQLRSNVKYGTVSYDPTMLSSDMLNCVTKDSHVLLAENDASYQSGAAAQPDGNFSFANISHPLPSNTLNPTARVTSGDPENWIEINQNSVYMKPSGYGEMQFHHSDTSNQNSQKHYGDQTTLCNSSPFCQNTLQEVVTSATIGPSGLAVANLRDVGHRSWAGGGNISNELVLLTANGDLSNPSLINNASSWTNRPVDSFHEYGSLANKGIREGGTAVTQALSLSLSSVQTSKIDTFGELDDFEDMRPRTGVLNDPPGSKTSNSDYVRPNSCKASIGSKVFGSSTRQNMLGTSTLTHQSTGPLGPFTGYATILKCSKYLKPSQQLLDEFCGGTRSEPIKLSEVYADKNSEECMILGDGGGAVDSVVGSKDGDSGASSSTYYGSNEISGDVRGRSSSTECYRPEYQQKKATLLYMQEECKFKPWLRENYKNAILPSWDKKLAAKTIQASSCVSPDSWFEYLKDVLILLNLTCDFWFFLSGVERRYKQYHQQMQMVVSSFESVAGLSMATPYISQALKAVSRHFRSLKNAISDQLRHLNIALGEDLPSPTTGTSSSKGDTSTPRLKFDNHNSQKHSQKHKSGGSNNLAFFEPQPPVWRPQRGLPERAVSILRRWLFDHFLHPYPTDTDKHMLATQTGLTRNQGDLRHCLTRKLFNTPKANLTRKIHELKGVVSTLQKTLEVVAPVTSTNQPHLDPSDLRLRLTSRSSYGRRYSSEADPSYRPR
ncbi:LOW QUALITY PROTEIN: hypothetical protein RJ639_026733 [Escallonia herrerae]|uniref:POX domain-containing protein n=1 Tax=Escallonia herrerae TaxID=1293975 RepID=A0AA88X7L8_9ASTE|nr:LOW QUALITY PROTEIN: hypothetical protein RJ639_026733 [Escallonia herrerae]